MSHVSAGSVTLKLFLSDKDIAGLLFQGCYIRDGLLRGRLVAPTPIMQRFEDGAKARIESAAPELQGWWRVQYVWLTVESGGMTILDSAELIQVPGTAEGHNAQVS